jgi:hypothetical protein
MCNLDTVNVAYIEESLGGSRIPKGFKLKWTPQGLDEETVTKAGLILKDASLRLMEVCLRGMERKIKKLDEEVTLEMVESREADRELKR